jgi:hypothetical protein
MLDSGDVRTVLVWDAEKDLYVDLGSGSIILDSTTTAWPFIKSSGEATGWSTEWEEVE